SSAYYDPWCWGCYRPYGWGFHFGLSFGDPYFFGARWYDPFYSPFYYRHRVFADPFYFGYGYRPFGYYAYGGRFVDRFCWGDPFCYRSGFYRVNFANRGSWGWRGIGPDIYSRNGYTLGGRPVLGVTSDSRGFGAVPGGPSRVEPRRRYTPPDNNS